MSVSQEKEPENCECVVSACFEWKYSCSYDCPTEVLAKKKNTICNSKMEEKNTSDTFVCILVRNVPEHHELSSWSQAFHDGHDPHA